MVIIAGVQGRPWLLAWIAVSIGVLAFVLVWRNAPPRSAASGADYYCYELRQGWVCMYRQADCEARAASEPAGLVTKRCAARSIDVPSP